ncbi:MAG: hypothetical protein IJ771_07590 [Clostridia bacterium]|nr:hypothetical protein [Clostridia bacterium]
MPAPRASSLCQSADSEGVSRSRRSRSPGSASYSARTSPPNGESSRSRFAPFPAARCSQTQYFMSS